MTEVPYPSFIEEKTSYEGVPCVIIGNSPSVNQEDLHLLDGCVTIGVNRILRRYVPNYLLFCDAAIVKQEQDLIKEYAGRKLVYKALYHQFPWLNQLDGSYMWDLHPASRGDGNHADLSICESRDPAWSLQRQGSTPAYAIQIAHLWGCNPIAVIGVDFNAKVLDKRELDSHFYGSGRAVKSSGGGVFNGQWEVSGEPSPKNASVGRNGVWYTGVRDCLNDKGVETINLSNIDDAPFHGAGWRRMTIKDFYDTYISIDPEITAND